MQTTPQSWDAAGEGAASEGDWPVYVGSGGMMINH